MSPGSVNKLIKKTIALIFPAAKPPLYHFIIISILYYLIEAVKLVIKFWNVPIEGTKSSAGEVILNLLNNGKLSYFNPEYGITFFASRMPVIPCFYAGLAWFFPDNLWFVFLIKNLLFLPLLFYISYYFLLKSAEKKTLASLTFLVLIFSPQFMFHLTGIDFEEGFIIPLFVLQFAVLFSDSRQWPYKPFTVLLLFSLTNVFLFLIKSSLLILCTASPLFFKFIHKTKFSIIFGYIFLLAGMIGWGIYNYNSTGEFRITSSIDGMNFYKGNNEETVRVYPRDLDQLHLVRPDKQLSNEWEFNSFYYEQGIKFLRENPETFIRLGLKKAFFFFFDFNIAPYGIQFGKIYYTVILIFSFFMRIVFLYSLFAAFISIFRKDVHLVLSLVYLLSVLLYSAPFVIGFAYTRHFYPLVIPSLFFLIKTGRIDQLAFLSHKVNDSQTFR